MVTDFTEVESDQVLFLEEEMLEKIEVELEKLYGVKGFYTFVPHP